MLPQSQNASTMVRLYRCMFHFWTSINKYLFWRKLTALLDEQSDGQGVPREVHRNLETTMKLRRLWVKGPAPSFSKKNIQPTRATSIVAGVIFCSSFSGKRFFLLRARHTPCQSFSLVFWPPSIPYNFTCDERRGVFQIHSQTWA